MVKAHSLLYAIYVCLIVAVMCGALLCYSSLYGQLNNYYNLQEELYINNQSLVNFALGSKMVPTEIPNDDSGISGSFTTKTYGMLTLLQAVSSVRNDSVTSVNFTGYYPNNTKALHMAGFSMPLSYSGAVTIHGDCVMPTAMITQSYSENGTSNLSFAGKITASAEPLPEINPKFTEIFKNIPTVKITWGGLEKLNDSLYFNSFNSETKEINVGNTIEGKTIKGNFILRAADSIFIRKNAILEDVIVIAPKIIFEQGFSGTLQAFATQSIIGEQVNLHFPSVLCVYNNSNGTGEITIGKQSRIEGAVVLFGNELRFIDNNIVSIDEGGLVVGDIYCSGKLQFRSKIYGTIYANRLFYSTPSSTYENRIANMEINPAKRPAYFIPVSLFNDKTSNCGILKKVR